MLAQACVPVTDDAEGHRFFTECSFVRVLGFVLFRVAAHIQNVLLKLFSKSERPKHKVATGNLISEKANIAHKNRFI